MTVSTTVGSLTVRVDSLADLVAVKPSTPPYALVSSDDTWLSAGGGVSSAVLMHAGAPVRAEMDEIVQKAGGALPLAQTVVTAGGATGAERIIHAVVADWNEQRVVRQEMLSQLLLRVLDHASSLGLAAVVLPALGTGRADVPFEEFLHHFRAALSEHARARTALREVVLVSPWELPTGWLEGLGASVREPRSPLAVAEQWSSKVLAAVERALRENLSARSVRGALDALLDAIVDRVRSFVAAGLPSGITIPPTLRNEIVSRCIDRIEETRHGASIAPTLRALIAASEEEAAGDDAAWVSVWRDLFTVLEGLPLAEWATLVGAVGSTAASGEQVGARASLAGIVRGFGAISPSNRLAVLSPIAGVLGAAWNRFNSPSPEVAPAVEMAVESPIQRAPDPPPVPAKSPRAQRPGETPTSRLCDLLLAELSESERPFLRAAVDRRAFKGDFRHRLLEYSLGEDPNALLGFFPIERRWEIARRSAGVRDELLGDDAAVRSALLAWLGFRSPPAPEGMRALRHRVELAGRKAELEGADALVRVGEAARLLERILKTVLEFHCQAHFGQSFEDVAREHGWSSYSAGLDRLTLGSLLTALRSIDKALHDRATGEAWRSFRDVYGERALLPKGESVLAEIRNRAVHDRACSPDDARKFFVEANALLRFFTETDQPIFPLIIRVRGIQEDDYGRRLYLAIDDDGREERLHTALELQIGRLYHMLPLSNPVRVFPVVVPATQH